MANLVTHVIGVAEWQNVTGFIGDITEMEKGIESLNKKLAALGMDIPGLAKAAAGITLITIALRGMASAIKGASKLQGLEVGFEALTGSMEDARNLMRELMTFAAKNPLDTMQALEAGQSLLAQGFDRKTLVSDLSTIGDMAALSPDPQAFEGIVRAMGQIRTKSTLQAEELNQLAERGVPVRDVLATSLAKRRGGTAEDWLAKLGAGTSGLTGKEAIDEVLAAFRDSRFNGIMGKKGQILEAQWNNTLDNLNIILSDSGRDLVSALTPLATAAASTTEWLRNVNQAMGGKVGLVALVAALGVGTILTAGFVVKLIRTFKNLDFVLMKLAASSNLAARSIDKLTLNDIFDPKKGGRALGDELKNDAKDVAKTGVIAAVLTKLKDFFIGVKTLAGSVLGYIWNFTKGIGSVARTVPGMIAEWVSSTVAGMVAALAAVIATPFKLASMGYLLKPGEHGSKYGGEAYQEYKRYKERAARGDTEFANKSLEAAKGYLRTADLIDPLDWKDKFRMIFDPKGYQNDLGKRLEGYFGDTINNNKAAQETAKNTKEMNQTLKKIEGKGVGNIGTYGTRAREGWRVNQAWAIAFSNGVG